MTKIFWDTMLFIYLLEDHPEFAPRVAELAGRMQDRGDRLCTSALAAAEVLAGAERCGDLALRDQYVAYFTSGEIDVLPFDLGATRTFAQLRGHQRIAAPDAIHLACAATAGVDLFVTHDKRLAGKRVPGLRFLTDLGADFW